MATSTAVKFKSFEVAQRIAHRELGTFNAALKVVQPVRVSKKSKKKKK